MTPIRRQYLQIKRRFPDTIVLFRLGDFYETFDEDAALCANLLGLTLTSRPMGKDARIPMAGIPHHALNGYLARLVHAGHRVALCEQMGDPKASKGLVERDVTQVVTPGTLLSDDLLGGVAHNFLAALVVGGEQAGIAWADVSTGYFATAQLTPDQAEAELARLAPSELLLPAGTERPGGWQGVCTTAPAVFDHERVLLEHFGATTLAAYGCDGLPLAVQAAACVVAYLRETQPGAVAGLTTLHTDDQAAVMTLDPQTRRNLDLFEPRRSDGRPAGLLAVLDTTRTAMGARLLREHLSRPLRRSAAIRERLAQVQWLVEQPAARLEVREALKELPDVERLITRVGAGVASPRDVAGLRRALSACAALRDVMQSWSDAPLPCLPDTGDAVALIAMVLQDEPGAAIDGLSVIRPGFHTELDETRALAEDARTVLADLERSERERTGIRNLRITYNRVFGYAIEVSAAQVALAPPDYQRRQTLAGGERFITPQLKELENRIIGAQERIKELEAGLFRDLCTQLAAHTRTVRLLATVLATLDVAAANAETAAVHGYTRPEVDDGDRIEIRQGRHPVVERGLPSGAFVPNDTHLGPDEQIIVLTGPNMAGKSTYLRQVALITLMAQAGCYVPATAARIGVVDRIFTRVGAQDDLAAGASTFMVEMVETAHILHHATPRSLVILDEVGRGTSTYDGMAIARAVIEYLHNQRAVTAKTLFATHYHELTDLAAVLPRVRNATVAVAEHEGEVTFLRQIVPGGADRSYGVHVAQLAGMPRPVVQRAQAILADLEAEHTARRSGGKGGKRARKQEGLQISLFAAPSPLVEELAALDVDALTPLQALTTLFELRERARAGGT